MRLIDWRTGVRALLGFAIGLVIWMGLTPLYDRVVAAGAETAIRAFEEPKVTRLRQAEDGNVIIDRSDFDPRSQRPAIAIYELTFNFVLLTALFAGARRPFSDRNIGGYLAACAILAITHIFGAIAEVMSIYVAKLGVWSQVHYSDLERNLWGVADHANKLVLMFAVVFALWWALRDPGEVTPKRKKRR